MLLAVVVGLFNLIFSQPALSVAGNRAHDLITTGVVLATLVVLLPFTVSATSGEITHAAATSARTLFKKARLTMILLYDTAQ